MEAIVKIKCSHHVEDDVGNISDEFEVPNTIDATVEKALVKDTYTLENLSALLEAIVKNEQFLDSLLNELTKSVSIRTHTNVIIESINDGKNEITAEQMQEEYGLEYGVNRLLFPHTGEWKLESAYF